MIGSPGAGARRCGWLVAAALFLGACDSEPDPAPAESESGQTASSAPSDDLELVAESLIEPWHGDLQGMVERRMVRVLVPYSRTFYFVDGGGNQRGLSYEFMEAFEDELNDHLGRGHMRVRVVFVPVTRDRLIPWLTEGRGDLIAANLTPTEERRRAVDFSQPWRREVREVLVSGPGARPVDTLDDLSGRKVLVRPKSSYRESIDELNRQLRLRKRRQVHTEDVPGHFETGDMLEMVNAGVVDYTVADDYLARFWAQVLPDITVHEDTVLRDSGEIAFAVRKSSPELKDFVDSFLEQRRSGTLFGNITFRRYLEDTRWVIGSERDEALERYARMADLFRRYGNRYELDWLMLLAQGYQESRLDQSARSSAGAVGVMQLLPATAGDLGVGDITELENNIHAGARYVRWMIDRYYADESMDPDNRLLFALASYNAGPRRVREMRNEAKQLGLDPNVWFDNVEHIAAQRIGRETVAYVSNIFKYHIAFRLVSEGLDEAMLQPRPDRFATCPDMVC